MNYNPSMHEEAGKGVFARLRERRLVRWGVAYIAGAWVALQAAELLGGIFSWPTAWLRALTVLLVFGFFAAITLAWFHGKKGRQSVSFPEILILAIVAVAAIVTVRTVDFDAATDEVTKNLFAGKTTKRATANPFYEAGPSWAPDARSLVFSSERSGNGDLWIMQRDGGVSQLTSHAAEDSQPAWSPDGRTILFVSSRNRADRLDRSDYYGYSINGDIWSVAAFGGEPRRLVEDAYNPNWAPRGDRFAFDAPRNGAHRIWTADADGGNPRRISDDESDLAVHIHPAWSPDGAWIAYERQLGSQSDAASIVVTAVDGSATFVVAADEHRNMTPAWVGSNTLVFASDRGGAINLWQANVDLDNAGTAGEPAQVTLGAGEDYFPAVASDGTLAYVSMRRLENLWKVDVDPKSFDFSDEPQRVLYASWNDIAPRLSPDGTTLGFSSDRDGKYDLWMLDEGASEPRQVTDWEGADLQLVWTPDGSRIAFYSNQRGVNDIWIKPVGPGPAVVVTPEDSNELNPYWSPDGKRIGFTSDRSGSNEVWVMDVDGSNATQLTDIGVLGHTALWSPNGEWLLFTSTATGNRDVWAVRADGSDLRQLTSTPTQDAHGLWSADGKHVVYLSDHQVVHVRPFDQDIHEKVFDLAETIDHTHLSKDGRTFFFTREKIEGDIFLME